MQLLVYLDALIRNSKYILEKQVKPGAISVSYTHLTAWETVWKSRTLPGK